MSVERYKCIYLSETYSDVTLVIGDYETPAHRSILSEKSEYFKTMFSSDFAEAKADKIVLKDINLKAFEYVLKYMYLVSDQEYFEKCIPSELLFEVLTCAQYFMVDLAGRLVKKLKDTRRYSLLLNDALAHSVDELISYATGLILEGVANHMNETIFKELSPLAVSHLLKLPLNTLESDIFKALVWWMRMNPIHSNAFPGLLQLVEIHLLNVYQLDMLFVPTLLIDPDFYKSLLTEQRIFAQRVQKIVNKNLIGSTDDLRIVNGQKTLEYTKLRLALARNAYCITIDLKHLFVINCLKFHVKDNVGYAVTVCKYMRNWDCVVDHFDYYCTGPQVLYFDDCVVRFISIRFLESVSYYNIRVSNVEALYSTDPFEKDSKTGLCIPIHDLVEMRVIRGNLSNDHLRHEINRDGSIIFQFAQPYVVDSLKLLLQEESSYYVEVATHSENWTCVFMEEDVTGWRIVTFKQQAVAYVKIVGTKAPWKYFELYKLECPAT